MFQDQSSMSEKTVVCVCGGGNGAHVISGLAATHARLEVRVLTLFQNEAADWTKKLSDGGVVVVKQHPGGRKEEITGTPAFVTNDASRAVTGADVIIFCLPAFAHRQYFQAIEPHIETNTSIIGLPGQPGFEFQCFHILKDKAKSCSVLNYETLPWACRIAEFGRRVDLLGTKDALLGSRVKGEGQRKQDPAALLQTILGGKPTLRAASGPLEMLLMTKAFVHPPFMYGRWKDWDGRPLTEKPLFYQGLSEYEASLACSVSQEILNTTDAILKVRPNLELSNVEHIESWFVRNYRDTVKDPTSLYTAMRTNSVYDGLTHPMREVSPGQWVPDFRYRYLSEDVPFGLAVTKGVAQILDVSTPLSDTVLAWAQRHLGTDVIRGDTLSGTDLDTTRAPQAFGIHTLDGLLAFG